MKVPNIQFSLKPIWFYLDSICVVDQYDFINPYLNMVHGAVEEQHKHTFKLFFTLSRLNHHAS